MVLSRIRPLPIADCSLEKVLVPISWLVIWNRSNWRLDSSAPDAPSLTFVGQCVHKWINCPFLFPFWGVWAVRFWDRYRLMQKISAVRRLWSTINQKGCLGSYVVTCRSACSPFPWSSAVPFSFAHFDESECMHMQTSFEDVFPVEATSVEEYLQ